MKRDTLRRQEFSLGSRLLYFRSLIATVIIALTLLFSDDLRAQSTSLSTSTLRVALETISTDFGVDIIYADKLVENTSHSCTYEGKSLQKALDCVLRDLSINSKILAHNQIVISASKLKDESKPSLISLKGEVVDKESKLPVIGAHVFLPKLRIGTITNEHGEFAISIPEDAKHSIEVSHVGYESATFPLLKASSIELTPSSFSAVEVIVDASQVIDRNDPFEVITSDLDLINDSRWDRSAFSSKGFVFQPVQWLPGVRRTGEIGGNLLVRGGLPDQNQFLLEGAPVYQPWHAQGLVSIFEPASIKSLEIFDSVIPTKYGGSLSSVINAELKSPNQRAYHGNASLGSFSTALGVGGPIARGLRFSLGGRISHRGIPGSSLPDTRRTALPDLSFYDMHSKLEFDLNPIRRLSISAYISGDNLINPGEDYSLVQYLNGDVFQESDLGWSTKLLSLSDRQILGSKTIMKSTIYASTYRAMDGSRQRSNPELSENSVLPNVGVSDIGFKWDWSTWLNDSHENEFGLSLSYQNYFWLDRTLGASLITEYRREANLYFQDLWTISNRWQLLSGMRVSYQTAVDKVYLLPRAELRFAPLGKKLQASLGYSRQVQYNQRIIEESGPGAGYALNNWVPSGEGFLNPALSEDVHMSLVTSLDKSLTLSTDVYWRRMNNVLVGQTEGLTQEFSGNTFLDKTAPFVSTLPFSPGNLRSLGAEFIAMYARPRENAWISYTLSSSMINELDSDRWIESPYHAPHLLRGAYTRYLGAISLTLAGQYTSAYPFSAWTVDITHQEMPSYFRMDAGVGFDFRLPTVSGNLQIQVYNITGNRNLIAQSVLQQGVPTVQKKEGIGLWPNLKLSLEF